MSGLKKALRKAKDKLSHKRDDESVTTPKAGDEHADVDLPSPELAGSPEERKVVPEPAKARVKDAVAAVGRVAEPTSKHGATTDVAAMPQTVVTEPVFSKPEHQPSRKAVGNGVGSGIEKAAAGAAPTFASASTASTSAVGASQPAVPTSTTAGGVSAAATGTPSTTSEAPMVITLKHIFLGCSAFTGLLLLLGLAWEKPSVWEFLFGALLFLPVGWLYAFAFRRNEIRKQESNNLLRVNPGIKGLNYLLGQVPSWVNFKDKEKAQVLNAVVKEMWPYIDKAVASSVREAVEPLLDQYKPGFISRIYFKDFTFGGAPCELDNVWVDEATRDKVIMEVDLRWSADTANIALAVDMLGGSDLTRLVVRVTDIALSGTARVTFQPLIDEYPGFGAMTVALMGIPILRYRPDFGKLGGQFSAKGVQVWLDGMIRNVLLGMMVWPERLVIPMNDVSVTGPLDKLFLHNVGALRLDVIEGRGLTNMDTMSKSDPFVEAFTNPKHREATRVINNNLDPKWNERLWFLIQEPDTQFLYLECYDHDNVSIREMIKLNMTGGARDLIGRCKIPLKDICAAPGTEHESWYDLGREEFSNFEGCGMGEGQVRIKVSYFPLGTTDPETASIGSLLLTLVSAANLPMEGPDDPPDPFFTFSLADSKRDSFRSQVVANNRDPEWPENKFEVSKVKRTDVIKVELNEADSFSRTTTLGMVTIKVAHLGYDLVTKTWPIELNKNGRKRLKFSPDDTEPATVTLKMQWIPFE